MKMKMKKTDVADILNKSDEIQEKIYKTSYVHHDHGGREHGHDWDDWIKAERSMQSLKKKSR